MLLHFREEVQDRTILLCDNATAVAYLRKEGGTRSRSLCLFSWEILNLCQVLRTHLQMRHIPSHLNALVDSQTSLHGMAARSDTLQSSTSVVTDVVYRSVRDVSQYPLPHFVSPFPDKSAVGIEALPPPRGSSGA